MWSKEIEPSTSPVSVLVMAKKAPSSSGWGRAWRSTNVAASRAVYGVGTVVHRWTSASWQLSNTKAVSAGSHGRRVTSPPGITGATPVAIDSSCTMIRPVAPHTVSSSSSKKWMARSSGGLTPALLPVDLGVEEVDQRGGEDAVDLAGRRP